MATMVCRTSSSFSASATLSDRSSRCSISRYLFCRRGAGVVLAAMLSLQLVAQGADDLLKKTVPVTRNAPQLLRFGAVRFRHALHFFALGADGSGVLLEVVVGIGRGLLDGTPLFKLQVFELLSHYGDCLAQMSCFARGLMGYF